MARGSSTGAPKNKQVNLKVTEDRKVLWKQTVQQSDEYRSLTDLIIKSVNREIQGADEPASTTGGTTNLDGVNERLDELHGQIQQNGERLDAMREASESEASFDLRKATLSMLPDAPTDYERGDEPTPNEYATTAESIATSLGADESDVTDELQDMKDTMSSVKGQYNSKHETVYWWRVK